MSKKSLEFRNINFELNPDSRTIVARIYYNSDSEYIGYIERLAPGCFAKTLAESKDIRALIEHSEQRLLARTKNNSLRFTDTPEYLQYEFEAPNTQDGNDILELTRANLVNGSSFGMIVVRDKYEIKNGAEYRTILEAKLVEVSVILSEPAYPATSVFVRSLSEAFKDKEQLSDEELTSVREEIDKLSALLPKDQEPAPEATNPPEPEQPATEPETTDPEPDEKQLEAIMQRLEAAQEKLRNLTNDDSRFRN